MAIHAFFSFSASLLHRKSDARDVNKCLPFAHVFTEAQKFISKKKKEIEFKKTVKGFS